MLSVACWEQPLKQTQLGEQQLKRAKLLACFIDMLILQCHYNFTDSCIK